MYTTMVFSYSAIISQVDLRHSTDAARPRYRDNGRSKYLGDLLVYTEILYREVQGFTENSL